MPNACIGGSSGGESLCASGHSGVLCAVCAEHYVRTHVECSPCAERTGTTLVSAITLALIIVAVAAYLYFAAGQRQWWLAEWLGAKRQVPTVAKILLGYFQVLSAIRRFDHVLWPQVFVDFLKAFDWRVDLELLPLDCIAGRSLTAYEQLLATLLMPLVGSLCIFALAALVAFARRTTVAPGSAWTLHLWMLLFLYPTLCRRTLSIFDCVSLRGRAYLRDDAAQECFAGAWFAWAVVACGGIAGYCLGFPAAAYIITRSHGGYQEVSSTDKKPRGNRAALLLSSYVPDCSYYESLDLLRKLVLTSVVLVVAPNSMVQLWFGLMASAAAVLICIKLQPYASRLCQRLQLAASLQILVTYMTATVFYTDPRLHKYSDGYKNHDAATGALLVAANCVCFVLLLVVLVRAASHRRIDLALRFDGDPSKLLPPRAGHYHCFLSHVWLHAQDQVADIKSLLRSLVPESRCFLDVDNLSSIADLEVYLQQSDVVLVFVTRGYLKSPNCRRELVEAARLQKPLLVVRETDINHGAVTEEELRAEVMANADLNETERAACALLIGKLADAIEWFREAHLKHAALSEIVNALFEATNGVATAARVSVRGTLKPPPCAGIYISEHYARDVRQKLGEAFGVPLLAVREAWTPVIVLLCPGVFEDANLVEELLSLLAEACAPLVPLFSTELPFAAYAQSCPDSLRDAGLLNIMFNKWPGSNRLRRVAAENALHKLAQSERRRSESGGLLLPHHQISASRKLRRAVTRQLPLVRPLSRKRTAGRLFGSEKDKSNERQRAQSVQAATPRQWRAQRSSQESTPVGAQLNVVQPHGSPPEPIFVSSAV